MVDDEDFPRLSLQGWYLTDGGYVASTRNSSVLIHRMILDVTDPEVEIDHFDRNKLNNQRVNLRRATVAQNAWNRGSNSRSKSGFRGVATCTATGKWRCFIMANGVRINLGRYETAEDAAHAWDLKAKELYGDFACLNFPDFDYTNYVPKDTRSKSSRYRGVHFDKTHSDWVSAYYVNKKMIYVGRFATEIEAAVALRNSIASSHPHLLNKTCYQNLPVKTKKE